MKALMIGVENQVCKDMIFYLQVKYPDISVLTTERGSTGLDILKTELPDLVFVGARLKDITVIDLISKIGKLSHVPKVVVC